MVVVESEALASGDVMARLFSGTASHVAVQKEAAAHLLRLLEHYNWTRANPVTAKSRWRNYWRGVSQIERDMVVRFVSTRNDGVFGGPVDLQPLKSAVDDHAATCGNRKLVAISADVEQEFNRILMPN